MIRPFHEAAGERQINTLKQLIASDLPRGRRLMGYLTIQFVGVWRVRVINGTGWFNAKIFQPFIFCSSIDTWVLSHTRHVFDCLMVISLISPKYWTVHLYFFIDIEVIRIQWSPHPSSDRKLHSVLPSDIENGQFLVETHIPTPLIDGRI